MPLPSALHAALCRPASEVMAYVFTVLFQLASFGGATETYPGLLSVYAPASGYTFLCFNLEMPSLDA